MLSQIFIICGIILIICAIRAKKGMAFLLGLILCLIGIIYYKRTDYKSYLLMVYPLMDRNRSYNEYKELYHSLGWYYQCCNTSHTNIVPNLDGTWRLSGAKHIAKGPHGEHADLLRYIPNVDNFGPFTINNQPTWDVMPCCSGDYKLPITPNGNLYDWYSLQYFNVPIITNSAKGWIFAGSNKSPVQIRKVSTIASQSPNTTFSGFTLNDNGKQAEITPQDPLGLNNKIPLGLWAGPGPFYAGGRAIMRAMYYPHGPQYNPDAKAWSMSNLLNGEEWLSQYLTKELMHKTTNKDFNMKKYWVDGFSEGDYMEMGHVQQIPGMVQSTGYWFNYFGGGGTGVFHKIGRTPKVTLSAVQAMKESLPANKINIDIVGCSPRNKAHALFTLLWEVKNTPVLSQPSGSYILGTQTYTNGSELLHALYGTDDPWFITMWYANGYAPKDSTQSWIAFDANFKPLGKPIPDYTSAPVSKPGGFAPFADPLAWANPPLVGGGIGPNQKLITGQVDTCFTDSIKKLGVYDVNQPNRTYLSKMYGIMGDTNLGVNYANLCAFLLQAEFGPTDELLKYVTPPNQLEPQFPVDGVPGVGAITYDGLRYALTKGFMGNWFYDRVSNGISFDEPMNYFACVLGYEDIQMTCNTNTNGFWSYETIYTGLPKKEDNLNVDPRAYDWNSSVISKRQYPYLMDATYMGPATVIFNQLFASRTSQRDPFDISKSIPCFNLGGFDCNNTPGVTCTKGTNPDKNAWPNVYEGTCTTTPNIGMMPNSTNTAQVLWDENNFCHQPWGLDSYGQGGVLWGQQNGFGHSYCQADGDKPTLSSIWANVPYGGSGYGTGIVTKKSSLQKASPTNASPMKVLPLHELITNLPPPNMYVGRDPRQK